MKTCYVYITSNRHRTVFYTGMTNDLARRIGEHKTGIGSRFTSFYRVGDLLYFEEYGEVKHAISREKEIKGWRREKKVRLIQQMNPEMKDLASELW